jgi:hypothetical protein
MRGLRILWFFTVKIDLFVVICANEDSVCSQVNALEAKTTRESYASGADAITRNVFNRHALLQFRRTRFQTLSRRWDR